VLLLVTKSHGKKQLKIHLFRQGYARLASLKYVISEEEVQLKTEESPEAKSSPEKSSKKMPVGNRFMHLTNNAVQKDAE
jgi:hypothetical protein